MKKIFTHQDMILWLKKIFLNLCFLGKIPNVITYIVENLARKLINVFFFSMQNAEMQWWYHRILDFCKKIVLFHFFWRRKTKKYPDVSLYSLRSFILSSDNPWVRDGLGHGSVLNFTCQITVKSSLLVWSSGLLKGSGGFIVQFW